MFDPSNVAKFHYYHNRLFQGFLNESDSNRYIPFVHREVNGAGQQQIRTGETTMTLGTLIGYLGTEYRLLVREGLEVDDTAQRLFFALETLNQIDLFAETAEGTTPELNGYLVRHNFPLNPGGPPPNLTALDDAWLNAAALGQPGSNGFIFGRGELVPATVFHPMGNTSDHRLTNKPFGYTYSPVSRDHLIRIFWGLKAAATFLPPGISVPGRVFSDGETDLRRETLAIYKRIMDYLERNRWQIRTSHGDRPIGYDMLGPRMSVIGAYIRLTTGFQIPVTASPFVANFGGFHATMNMRMHLDVQNLGGTDYRLLRRARRYGQELFCLNYHIAVNDGAASLTASEHEELRKTTEFYLNAAPCFGPFYHDETDFAPFGWQGTDRTTSSLAHMYFLGMAEHGDLLQKTEPPGNYFGLDYLLLNNLYWLNFAGSIPTSLAKPEPETCSWSCQHIDRAVMAAELARVRNELRRMRRWYLITPAHFKRISQLARACLDQAEARYRMRVLAADAALNACLSSCGGRFFLTRLMCRLSCASAWTLRRARALALRLAEKAVCFPLAALRASSLTRYFKALEDMQSLCP